MRLHAHVESVVRPFLGRARMWWGFCWAASVGKGEKDQAVMYTAHYDLGFVPGMAGDNIYNGAADNATGCGMLLEMARAWTAGGRAGHSVIFAAVTAEGRVAGE